MKNYKIIMKNDLGEWILAPVEGHEVDESTFVIKLDKEWRICDYYSGMLIYRGKTRKEVIERYKNTLEQVNIARASETYKKRLAIFNELLNKEVEEVLKNA